MEVMHMDSDYDYWWQKRDINNKELSKYFEK